MADTPRPSPHRSQVELDAKSLRAVAHPVRLRLLGLLRTHGASTATRLAEQLRLASGATSYHLRQLAQAGLVVEDTERGNRRDRWWRAAHASTNFTSGLADEEPDTAMAFLQSVAAIYTERMQHALGELQTLPREWRDTLSFNDTFLRLTPEEARRLDAEVGELVARYRRAEPEDAAADETAPEGSRRVGLLWQVLPESAPGDDGGDQDDAGDQDGVGDQDGDPADGTS